MTTPPTTRTSRLIRSREDRMIAGIAGGLARHLAIDPVLVRLGFVALALVGGVGILAYLIAWIVIPEEPVDDGTPLPRSPSPRAETARIFVGIALVLIGIGVFAEIALPDFGDFFWPIVLIAAGGGLLYSGAKR